jgi:hypothetical protein
MSLPAGTATRSPPAKGVLRELVWVSVPSRTPFFDGGHPHPPDARRAARTRAS